MYTFQEIGESKHYQVLKDNLPTSYYINSNSTWIGYHTLYDSIGKQPIDQIIELDGIVLNDWNWATPIAEAFFKWRNSNVKV